MVMGGDLCREYSTEYIQYDIRYVRYTVDSFNPDVSVAMYLLYVHRHRHAVVSVSKPAGQTP